MDILQFSPKIIKHTTV